jgi:hypothetical protein
VIGPVVVVSSTGSGRTDRIAGFSVSSNRKSRSNFGSGFALSTLSTIDACAGSGAATGLGAAGCTGGSAMVRSASNSVDDNRAVFSSSDSAPARMSAGDFGFAPDVGEIEISSSIWNSRP